MMTENVMRSESWPSLPLDAWSDTCATLQLWTQIVGKIRLVQTPWTNHSWHATLHVTPRGLTTGAIYCETRALHGQWQLTAIRE